MCTLVISLKIPRELVPAEGRKLVLVTDLYHLPRAKRYFNKDFPVSLEQTILYPSKPDKLRVKRALSEVKKIPKYVEGGLLPEEGEEAQS